MGKQWAAATFGTGELEALRRGWRCQEAREVKKENTVQIISASKWRNIDLKKAESRLFQIIFVAFVYRDATANANANIKAGL